MKGMHMFLSNITILIITGYGGVIGLADITGDYPESFTLTVQNPLAQERSDEAVVLDIQDIREKHPDFNPHAFVIMADNKEIPSQAVSPDHNDLPDHIVFVTDLQADQTRTCTVRYAKTGTRQKTYPKRTQAEMSHKFGGEFVNGVYQGGDFKNVQSLRVPPECTDHSLYIRYEGPGWESDKVGYRFYLDWRNAVDIYGKKVPDMVLQDVGLDGYESYHEMADWGMDILKVGDSLGIGSVGMWINNKAERVAQTKSLSSEIIANGPVHSQIRTHYEKWSIGDATYDLTADLSIRAGSRLTRCDLHITGQPANLCTGIVKHDNTEVLKPTKHNGGWTYLATYGKQSLVPDNLGMAVLYRQSDLIELTQDPLNHVVVLKPAKGKITYYFLAAWEKEPNGITSKEAFMDYLNNTTKRLNALIKVQ